MDDKPLALIVLCVIIGWLTKLFFEKILMQLENGEIFLQETNKLIHLAQVRLISENNQSDKKSENQLHREKK